MSGRFAGSPRRVLLLVGAVLPFLAGTAAAQQLDLWIGERRHLLDTRVLEGELYCRVDETARLLGLEVREGESRLTLVGPRGALELTVGRPLVRLGDQYILLSGDAWMRRRGEWYVPEDFLEKVLPLILDRRLSRAGRTSFRLDRLDENEVRVEVVSYPGRLSVVFHSSLTAPVEVRDLRDFVAVTFGEHLVRPGRIESPAERNLLSAIRFEAADGMGGFRLEKGPNFARFRQYRFSNPPRLVLDIYGPESPRSAEAAPSTPDPVPETRELQVSPTDAATLVDRREAGAVVIDPGHGGEDYGVDIQEDVLEKMLALDLSRLIEGALRRTGERTVLTRFRDVSLPTEQRSAVTNFHRAGVYVGIHIGGAPSPELRGAVVYVYEPTGELGNGNPVADDSGGEPTRLVRWDQAQLPYLPESRRLAGLLQSELNHLFEVENSVVRAPLAVLGAVGAPAVLIEAGFLTNPDDRDLLYSRQFQSELAELIAGTIRRFNRVR